MIDLNAYCASRFDSRAAMRSPYRDGDHIVATDRRIMIVIDTRDWTGIADAYQHVTQAGLPSFHQLDRYAPGPVWHRLADIELPSAVTCGLCSGSGIIELGNDEERKSQRRRHGVRWTAGLENSA